MLKRTLIATALAFAELVLLDLANPWARCRLGLDWWRCVQFELAAQRAEERAAKLGAIEHGE